MGGAEDNLDVLVLAYEHPWLGEFAEQRRGKVQFFYQFPVKFARLGAGKAGGGGVGVLDRKSVV